MKYAIFGDVHSNFEAFAAIVKEAEKNKVGYYVCTGDLIGYGPDPSACVNLLKSLPFKAYAGGNHEAALLSSEMFDMNKIARQAIYYTDKNLSSEEKNWIYESADWTKEFEKGIQVAHGSLRYPENFPYLSISEFERKICHAVMKEKNCSVLFVGHTHSPSLMPKNAKGYPVQIGVNTIKITEVTPCIIDVGSVGQPRDKDPRASFAIYDTDSGIVTRYRVEYDVEKTAKKIIDAGLPECLANRIKLGK